MKFVLLEICAILLLSATAEFTNCPLNQELEEGLRGTIRCQAEGDELLPLQWYKDGKEIRSSSRYILEPKGLTITDVDVVDEGIYTVIHPAQLTSETIYVAVVAPVVFDLLEETVSAIEFSDATLTCMTRGRPSPTYIWLDSFPQQNRDMSTLTGPWSVNKRTGTLRFSEVLKEHEGIYTCVASNSVNTLSKLFTLVVLSSGIPGQIRNVSLVEVTDTTATFDIIPPQDDPDVLTTHYLIKFQLRRDDMPVENTTIPFRNDNRYVLKDLKAGDGYYFWFAAANDEGVGPLTDKIEVLLFPPPPLILVHTKSSGEGMVTVSWELPYMWGHDVKEFELVYCQMPYEAGVMVFGKCPVKIMLSCEERGYTLARLFTTYPYKIFVRARNQAGFGRNSSVLVRVGD